MKLRRDYPYMYARVSAKRAKLLDANDYENLLKMQPNEIARNLGEQEYKEDIDDLGAMHSGVELVELALMRNVSRSMTELIEIAPETLKPIIRAGLRRYDILTIKRLLRWKKGGEKNNIESFLVPVSRYSFEELKELSEKSFEEICDSISFPDSEMNYQAAIEGVEDLRKIERNLDRTYYKEMVQISKKIGSQWFTRFMKAETRHENLKIALRLKKYDLDEDEIREWLISEDTGGIIDEVLDARDLEEAIDILRNSDLLEDSVEGYDIEEIEHGLEVAHLKRALKTLHTEPLGVTSILGYIVAKLIEIKNLRMLIRAKETGIQNLETIRKNLVVA